MAKYDMDDEPITKCKFAEPDANPDLTVFYHCTEPDALQTSLLEGFVDCLCLGVLCDKLRT